MRSSKLLGALLGVGLSGVAAGVPAARAADDIVLGFAVAQSGFIVAYDDNGTTRYIPSW